MLLLPTLHTRVRDWTSSRRSLLRGSFARLGGRWIEARFRRQARRLLARLETARFDLSALEQEIETRFLACGNALQEQVQLTARLKRQGEQLVGHDERVKRGETAVKRIADLTGRQLELGEEFAREVARLAGVLEEHAERLRQLHDEQRQIERSFAPIRALQSFFRIEAASLPAAMQTLFLGVAEEMRRLEIEVNRSFAAQDETFGDTRQNVRATAKDLHALAARHLGIAAARREEVGRAHRQLDADYEQARERHQRLHRAIAEIDRETDGLVVGLQFQDITRQRLEHVRQAAHDLLTPDTATAAAPFRDRMRRQQVLCRVQAVQLTAVRDELDGASSRISTGLRTVLRCLREIESDGLSLSSLREITAGMDAVTQETIEAHRVSAELMLGSLDSLTAAIRQTRGFADATTGAADALRGLATDIHLMGLNAQVQAVHAQSGSLEVLSRAASQISEEARTLGGRFEGRLVAITAGLTALVDRSETFRETTRTRYETLRAQGDTLLTELTAEHTQATASVQQVAELLHLLGQQADGLLGSAELTGFPHEAIEEMQDIFAQLADRFASAAPGPETGNDPFLAEAQARYTMDSERAAHERAIARDTLPAATTFPIGGAAGNSSREEPAEPMPGPDSTGPASPAMAASLGDNIELF